MFQNIFWQLCTGRTVVVHAPTLLVFSVASDGATAERQINCILVNFFTMRKDSVANYVSIWTLFSPSVRESDVLCNALNISQIRRQVAPQDSQNCGRNFAKRKILTQTLRQILRMVTVEIVINSALGRLTLYTAGMHCPAWDDAFYPRDAQRSIAGCMVRRRGWVAGWLSVTARIVSKRLNLT